MIKASENINTGALARDVATTVQDSAGKPFPDLYSWLDLRHLKGLLSPQKLQSIKDYCDRQAANNACVPEARQLWTKASGLIRTVISDEIIK